MSDRPEDWEYFQDLYRFAWVLTHDAAVARRVVLEALEAAWSRQRGPADLERVMTLLFKDVRARALKAVAPRNARPRSAGDLPPEAEMALAGRDAVGIQSELHALPEPGRTALTLLYLEVLDIEGIQKLLGVGVGELSELLQAARLELHAGVAGA